MVQFNEKTTVKFFKEVKKLTNKPENPEHKNLTGKKLKAVPKLYTSDTSKFAPIEENREHLINTLLPMVMKLSKDRCTTYFSSRIEFDDCLSAGMQGAIIATDLYIEKSKVTEQPAKLSTYAYSYIIKYINEYIYSNTTSLSHGVTKGREAMSKQVLSGNKTNESADFGSGEYFDTSNEPELQSMILQIDEKNITENLSKQMFSTLTYHEKTSLFMFFGISYERKYDINEIAKALNSTAYNIQSSIQLAFDKIRKIFSNISDKSQIIDLLLSTDLTTSVHWQKP